MADIRVVTLNDPAELPDTLAKLLQGAQSGTQTINLTEVLVKFQKAGYSAPDACAYIHALRCLHEINPRFLENLMHLAHEHDVLSAAKALEGIWHFLLDALGNLTKACEGAGLMELVEPFKPAAIEENHQRAHAEVMRIEAKWAQTAEVTALAKREDAGT